MPTPVRLTEGLTLWGAATISQAEAALFPPDFDTGGEGVHLLLAHLPVKSASSAEPESPPPLDLEAFQRAGFRYGLLGGSAEPLFFPKNAALLAYPGSPESVGFDCQTSGGALLARIDGNDIDVQPLSTRRLRFVSLQIDASGAAGLEAVREQVLAGASPDPLTILEVKLTGRVSPAVYVTLASLGQYLSAEYLHVDLRLEARPDFDIDRIAAQQNVRGSFVRRLLDQRRLSGRAQRKMIDEAIDAGLLALEDLEIPCP